jgi:hypothetical protein
MTSCWARRREKRGERRRGAFFICKGKICALSVSMLGGSN